MHSPTSRCVTPRNLRPATAYYPCAVLIRRGRAGGADVDQPHGRRGARASAAPGVLMGVAIGGGLVLATAATVLATSNSTPSMTMAVVLVAG